MNQERDGLEPGDLDWLRNEKDLLVGVHYGRCHKTPASRDGHNARIDRLLLALRSGGEGWRDISTAPKDATPIIAWNGHVRQWVRWMLIGFRANAKFGWLSAESGKEFDAKLWMPLPPSPSTHGEG